MYFALGVLPKWKTQPNNFYATEPCVKVQIANKICHSELCGGDKNKIKKIPSTPLVTLWSVVGLIPDFSFPLQSAKSFLRWLFS